MRAQINFLSWMVFLALLLHMAEGHKNSNRYLVAKRIDHPISWQGI